MKKNAVFFFAQKKHTLALAKQNWGNVNEKIHWLAILLDTVKKH